MQNEIFWDFFKKFDFSAVLDFLKNVDNNCSALRIYLSQVNLNLNITKWPEDIDKLSNIGRSASYTTGLGDKNWNNTRRGISRPLKAKLTGWL